MKNICLSTTLPRCVTVLSGKDMFFVEMSFLVHATEDREKVLKAVKNILPPRYISHITFRKNSLKGEYGNPIILYKTRISDSAIAEALVRNIGLKLSSLDKEALLEGLELRLKRGSLYLRLDKQAAYNGEHKLGKADPIHLRIRFRKSKPEEIKKTCQKLGMLP